MNFCFLIKIIYLPTILSQSGLQAFPSVTNDHEVLLQILIVS